MFDNWRNKFSGRSHSELKKIDKRGTIHDWTISKDRKLTEDERRDLDEMLADHEKLESLQNEWKEEYLEEWLEKSKEVGDLIERLQQIEPPLIEHGEVSPWHYFGIAWGSLREYDHFDTWFSSDLC